MPASITTWLRLEPVDQTSDLRTSLAAPIADPLWLLHRQWQLAELAGDDAGSPIAVTVEHEQVPLSRYRPGDPARAGTATAIDYDPSRLPLEPLVESERVRGLDQQHRRLAAETGAHLLRLLTAAGLGDLPSQYRARFPLQIDPSSEPTADPIGAEAATLLDGRAVEGDKVAAELRLVRNADGSLGRLPSSFPVGANRAAVLAVAAAWLDWYDELLVEPPIGAPTAAARPPAWDARRLEYQFATSSRRGSAATTFGSTAFDDGHLDWPDLSAGPTPNLGAPTTTVTPTTATDVVIPVRLTYAGMPAHRHWEIEDSRVSFATVEAGTTDIVRMLLTDFALVYGDDWFMLPVTVPVGSMVTIRRFTVRDTFGITSSVPPTVSSVNGSRRWAMYRLSPAGPGPFRAGGSGPDTLLVPPTVTATFNGPPLEEVAFFRDEMANLVWAVERTTPSPLGTPVDRYHNSQPAERIAVDVTDVGDAELVYRLTTPIPTNWYPYLPRRTPPGDDITLERLSASRPQGIIAAESASIEDEEISRGGTVVERAWQFTRWTNGQPLLWLGRRARAGRGEGSSGLAWDRTEPPPPPRPTAPRPGPAAPPIRPAPAPAQ